jgi:adenylate cyclase
MVRPTLSGDPTKNVNGSDMEAPPLAADYEAYLEQYPEGSFVTLALTRLEEFTSTAGGMRDPKDRDVELSFWESVRESDNPATVQAYLEKYPEGEFKALAEIRLVELGAAASS